MNIKEGTRRLSLAVGLLGAFGAALVNPVSPTRVYNEFLRRQRFEELSRRPVVQQILATSKPKQPGPLKTRRKELEQTVRRTCALPPDSLAEFEFLLKESQERELIDSAYQSAKARDADIPIYRDGIATIKASDEGKITEIVTVDGQMGDLVSENWYSESFELIASPLAAFFIPWGAIRGIAWIVAGFSKQKTEQ